MSRAGRKTTWSKELEDSAWDYVDGGWKEEGHSIPSVVGLCKLLGRSRETLYAWAKDKDKQFSDILKACNENQELTLLNGSLSGGLNANISKLVLGKHGYHETKQLEVSESDVTPWASIESGVDE